MHRISVLSLTPKAFECMTTVLWVLCTLVVAIAASSLGIGLRRKLLASQALCRSATLPVALPGFVSRRPDLRGVLNEERKNHVAPFCVSGLNKTEAEELLDWLEGHGCAGAEVTYLPETGFVVRRS